MSFPIVVMLSGNGSNLQAIIDAIATHQWPIHIAAVVSDRADAYGLTRAKQANIPTAVISPKQFSDKAAHDQALIDCLTSYQAKLIVLAGYMRILSPLVVNRFAGEMINIHPSLLPKYRGLHTHQQILKNGDKQHGTTIHIVTSDLDDGPILAQQTIDVRADDTVESLTERIKAEEHRLYPQVIYQLAVEKARN